MCRLLDNAYFLVASDISCLDLLIESCRFLDSLFSYNRLHLHDELCFCVYLLLLSCII